MGEVKQIDSVPKKEPRSVLLKRGKFVGGEFSKEIQSKYSEEIIKLYKGIEKVVGVIEVAMKEHKMKARRGKKKKNTSRWSKLKGKNSVG